jgi:acetyl esterase/lipase
MKKENTNCKLNSEIKKFSSLAILGFNIIALGGSITYLIYPMPYMLWNLYGYVIFLALFGNLLLACLGGRYRCLDYSYLVLHIVSMLLIPLVNSITSSNVQNMTSQSLFILFLYNFIFIFGTVNAGLLVKRVLGSDYSKSEECKTANSGKSKNVIRWIIVCLLGCCLFYGVYISYILLGRTTGNMIEVFIPVYAVYWGLLILGLALLIVKLRWRNKGSVFNKIVVSAGIVMFMVCMVPLVSVPFTIKTAATAYRKAFGDKYLNDRAMYEQHGFMLRPFSLQDYFFGKRTKDYIVIEDVLYYEGTTGSDSGIRLYFDVYMPSTHNSALPPNNSVLIRIHGGGWVTGGKGAMNYAATNKHFVNLGYVVFDIQYGLSNRPSSLPTSAVPTNVIGDFDIDDMIYHIGIFTAFLADHADEYGANLDSIFISGGSAGGQLAIASALGITSGKYTDILDPRLNIRGIIPFYPANGLPAALGIGGAPDLIDPIALIDEHSPPCLIFHGTHDGITLPIIAKTFQSAYEENNKAPSAILWMNFASHGSDIYTSGYYNQIFLYYMEKFMHHYK